MNENREQSPSFKELEQAAFEEWLQNNGLSGCIESIYRQWIKSSEYADFVDEHGVRVCFWI